MKALYYIMCISLGLLVLIFIEGLFTLGSAFNFENYGLIAWIVQTLLVTFTVSLTVLQASKTLK